MPEGRALEDVDGNESGVSTEKFIDPFGEVGFIDVASDPTSNLIASVAPASNVDPFPDGKESVGWNLCRSHKSKF